MDHCIDRLIRAGAARPDTVALGGGLPARELFPRSALAGAFVRALREPACGALQYGWPEGNEGLRAWIARRLRARGAAVDPGEVLITSGAQQALAIAAQILFQPGDRVGCAPESYPGALDLFRARRLVPTARGGDVAGVYTMPAIGNPRGLGLDGRAREALLARAARVPIVEDDAYADLRFAGPPPRPLLADDRRHVVHVGTFSKTLCPGLRVGWLVVPRRLQRRALDAKHASDLQANSLAQALLEDFLARADYDALLARARRFYASRAAVLERTVAHCLPSFRFRPPEGGLTMWVETDRPGDDAAFLATAIRHGVSVDPGRTFRTDGRASPIALRLSFANEPGPRIRLGVERLARAWDGYVRRRRAA